MIHLLHRLLHLLHGLTILCINQCLDIISQSVCFCFVHAVYLQNIGSTCCVYGHKVPKNSFFYSDRRYLTRIHSFFIGQPKQDDSSSVEGRNSISVDSD